MLQSSPLEEEMPSFNDNNNSQHQQETQNQQHRLTVEYIVLENFKSYAGRQVIGPFHQFSLKI